MLKDPLVKLSDKLMIEYLAPEEGFRTSYDQLRPVERFFVDAYVASLDPRLAVRSMPFVNKNKSDQATAVDLLKKPIVQAAIAEIMQARAKRYESDTERLRQELSAIAYASQSDYMRLDENGEPYYDLTGVSAEAMAAISEVSVEDYKDGRGENARDVRKVKIKLHDKLRAIEMLLKLNGAISPDSNTVNIQVNNNGGGSSGTPLTIAATPQEAAEAYAAALEND